VSQAYLDVKEEGCREHRGVSDGAARVNPANVVTGDRRDANLYAVYLVHEVRSLTRTPALTVLLTLALTPTLTLTPSLP
jgi:hypothetical protein